jgi:hypothetical protein
MRIELALVKKRAKNHGAAGIEKKKAQPLRIALLFLHNGAEGET